MTTHYQINGDERKIKLGSTGQFDPAPLCGSGDGNAEMTRTVEACDCGPCNEILAIAPAYLELNKATAWEVTGHVYPRDKTDGPEPVYWIWSDGEIYQITNTEDEPRTPAGYFSLGTLLELKDIEPRRYVEAERPQPGMRP